MHGGQGGHRSTGEGGRWGCQQRDEAGLEDTELQKVRQNERSTLEEMAQVYYAKIEREGVEEEGRERKGE